MCHALCHDSLSPRTALLLPHAAHTNRSLQRFHSSLLYPLRDPTSMQWTRPLPLRHETHSAIWLKPRRACAIPPASVVCLPHPLNSRSWVVVSSRVLAMTQSRGSRSILPLHACDDSKSWVVVSFSLLVPPLHTVPPAMPMIFPHSSSISQDADRFLYLLCWSSALIVDVAILA